MIIIKIKHQIFGYGELNILLLFSEHSCRLTHFRSLG